jgi:hypothetical protein
MRRAVVRIMIALPMLVFGCASLPRDGERPATSLVYSPGERVSVERQRERDALGSGGAGLRTGVRCRVHLRRDAMGLTAGQAPLSIVGTSVISERAMLIGTIERIEDDALVVRTDSSTYWVPREMILAVEFSDERRP